MKKELQTIINEHGLHINIINVTRNEKTIIYATMT